MDALQEVNAVGTEPYEKHPKHQPNAKTAGRRTVKWCLGINVPYDGAATICIPLSRETVGNQN